MSFLKGSAIALLGFLLFLCLSLFGIAFLVNQTILNPGFISSELDKIDVAVITEEIISEQEGEDAFSAEMRTNLIDTVTELEPVVKEGISNTAEPIYNYLLGKSEALDMALVIRENILSTEVITSIIDKLDIATIASQTLSEQLPADIPGELDPVVAQVDEIIANNEPAIKAELATAATHIADYLLGQSRDLSVVVSLESMRPELEDAMREAFLDSPPPELSGLPPAVLEQYFNASFGDISEMLPLTIEFDETIFPPELPIQITTALGDTEEGLKEVRQYVGYFQTGYYTLIGLIVVFIAGIILLHLEVKGATRKLGTIFLTYGTIEFIGIFVARYFMRSQLVFPDMPTSLQEWLPPLITDFLTPLQMFSLGCLIGGAVLIIVSFIYPRWHQAET